MLEKVPISLKDIVIRPLGKKELPALEWEGQYTHFRIMFRDAYQLVRARRAILWGAWMDNDETNDQRLVGQLFVQFESNSPRLADGKNRAFLYAFRIRENLRNLGLGSYLLGVVETDLQARGFSLTTLNCGRDNERALRFYRRHGYQVVSPEPGRWSYIDHEGVRRHVVEPAWRMEKHLIRNSTANL